MIVIDISKLYSNTAKIADVEDYLKNALSLAGEGEDVVLTGAAPVWLYLKIAHALHGKAKTMIYDSPVTGKLVIFDHNPF